MWPSASGEELVKVSVLHDGQLIASSELSKPQFTHFFIKLEAALQMMGGWVYSLSCFMGLSFFGISVCVQHSLC